MMGYKSGQDIESFFIYKIGFCSYLVLPCQFYSNFNIVFSIFSYFNPLFFTFKTPVCAVYIMNFPNSCQNVNPQGSEPLLAVFDYFYFCLFICNRKKMLGIFFFFSPHLHLYDMIIIFFNLTCIIQTLGPKIHRNHQIQTEKICYLLQ